MPLISASGINKLQKARLHACPPWGLPCRMELTSTLELAAQPWPRQLRQPS